jgi:hypothetical protein
VLASPEKVLEEAAGLFVDVSYRSPDAEVKERALFSGAEVLAELATVKEGVGRREEADAQLVLARKLLKRATDAARAAVRIKEIDRRREELRRLE